MIDKPQGEMQSTAPDGGRSEADFPAVVQQSFAFVERELGLHPVEVQATFVRYGAGDRFIDVYWGRSSYEIGVDVGRRVETESGPADQRFGLSTVMSLTSDPQIAAYRPLTAVSRDDLIRFVPVLAERTRESVTIEALSSDEFFDRLSELAAGDSERFLQHARASRLRSQAAEAWSSNDFGTAASLYREIQSDLPLVRLRPSEVARLEYSERHQ